MTLICVPIILRDAESALADAALARARGADLIELRIDEFFSGFSSDPDSADDAFRLRSMQRVLAESPLPVILTCRLADEGGFYEGDDMSRISLFERLCAAVGVGESPPRYLDVEFAAYTRSANLKQKVNLAVAHPAQVRDVATGLILSTHDFQGRPRDLSRRVLAMASEPAAAILKIAYRARSLHDALEVLDLAAESPRPTIALAMGEPGVMSRVLAPKFGAFLTFASLRPASATAPGQPTLDELLTLYRFRSITRDTAVLGIVGDPITHSRSPAYHNAAFASHNRNAVYLPLPVAAHADAQASYAGFKAALLELIHHPRLTFRGCSVTLPHKINLVTLAREQGWHIDDLSRAVGSANTLLCPLGATPRIANTDGPAAADLLASALGTLDSKRIVILGAGGVSRAIAGALALRGASITIINRTPARARDLARDLASLGSITSATLDDLPRLAPHAIINATSVGMHDTTAADASPVDVDTLRALGSSCLVMETIYAPERTPLLMHAQSLGQRTIPGAALFEAQAALQQSFWSPLWA